MYGDPVLLRRGGLGAPDGGLRAFGRRQCGALGRSRRATAGGDFSRIGAGPTGDCAPAEGAGDRHRGTRRGPGARALRECERERASGGATGAQDRGRTCCAFDSYGRSGLSNADDDRAAVSLDRRKLRYGDVFARHAYPYARVSVSQRILENRIVLYRRNPESE